MKPFQCDICHEGLDSRRQGFKHLNKMHGGSGSVLSSIDNETRRESPTPRTEYILPDFGDVKEEVVESDTDTVSNPADEDGMDLNYLPQEDTPVAGSSRDFEINPDLQPFKCTSCNGNYMNNPTLRLHQQNGCDPTLKQVDSVLQDNVYSILAVSNCPDLNYHVKMSRVSPDKSKFAIDPTTGKRSCTECRMPFNSLFLFWKHYKIVHLKLRIKCSACGKNFLTIPGFDKHQVVHHENVRFKCPDGACPRLFELESSVWKHRYSFHQSESPLRILSSRRPAGAVANCSSFIPSRKRYECNSCSCTFISEAKAQAHYKMVHMRVSYTYKCVLCCKEFWYRRSYNRHHLIVHLLAGNKCEKCGEPFHQKYFLEKHIRLGRCKAGKLDE